MRKVYKKEVESLKEVLYRYITERAPDRPEERRRGVAKALAQLFVLAAEYGAGDALAGVILTSYDRRETVENVHRVLSTLGVRNLPSPDRSLRLYLWDVMERADFGDEEVNNIMRELNKMAVTGGRYTPSLWRGKREGNNRKR